MKLYLVIITTIIALFSTACSSEDSPAVTPWPVCESVAMEGSLADKAAEYDRIAKDWHLSGDGLLRNVYLTEDLSAVELHQHVENTILWSGMYLGSQALRYAVTGNAEAVANATVVVKALRQLTEVTGSKGLYGRSMVKPGVDYNFDGKDNPGWTASPTEGYEGWYFSQ